MKIEFNRKPRENYKAMYEELVEKLENNQQIGYILDENGKIKEIDVYLTKEALVEGKLRQERAKMLGELENEEE